MCVHVGATLCMCMSEDSLKEFVFSFHHLVSEMWTQVFRLNSKHLDLLSHPASPFFVLSFGFLCLFLRWSFAVWLALNSRSPLFQAPESWDDKCAAPTCAMSVAHIPLPLPPRT